MPQTYPSSIAVDTDVHSFLVTTPTKSDESRSRTPSPPSNSSGSGGFFVSSPLNPSRRVSSPSSHKAAIFGPGTTPQTLLTRMPSEEARVLCPPTPPTGVQRCSMILYSIPDVNDPPRPPPKDRFEPGHHQHGSVSSTASSDSAVSWSSDSKYPGGATERSIVAYAYDPLSDLEAGGNEDRWEGEGSTWKRSWSYRGVANTTALGMLILALFCFFVVYPIIFSRDEATERSWRIVQNGGYVEGYGNGVKQRADIGDASFHL